MDVIISNCVINLSTDKDRVLKDAFRVLKPGGRFAVADLVLTKPISPSAQNFLALWAGCVAGALRMDEYKSKLGAAGFADAEVQVVRTYSESDVRCFVPEEAVGKLGNEELAGLVTSVASAFVRAVKPAS